MTGKALRKLRKAAGLSTAAAASAVLVSRRSWVRWESEGVPKSMELLVRKTWPGWWEKKSL